MPALLGGDTHQEPSGLEAAAQKQWGNTHIIGRSPDSQSGEVAGDLTESVGEADAGTDAGKIVPDGEEKVGPAETNPDGLYPTGQRPGGDFTIGGQPGQYLLQGGAAHIVQKSARHDEGDDHRIDRIPVVGYQMVGE